MDLHEVTRVLRKRLSWLAAASVTGLVLAALWTFTRTPLYQAVTQIEVVGDPGGHISRDAGFAAEREEATGFETHRYLLTSRRTLEATVASIDLGKRLPGAGADWLRKNVKVERVPDTRIFRIAVTAPDPALASDVANTLRDVYERDDIARRLAGAKKQLGWLEEQMVDVKAQVEQSELALITYIETADLDLVDMPAAGDAEGTGTDLTPTGSRVLQTLESDLAAKKTALSQGQLDRTEEHPSIMRFKDEMKILEKRIGEEKKRIAEENKKRIRYGMLRRDAELNRQLFHLLMKEVKETNLVGDEAIAGRIEVLEKAVAPRRPVYPRKVASLAMGLAAGLLFGIGLAFLQESLDRTLKTREEIERVLALSVLGAIHRVGGAARARGTRADSGERFVVKTDGGWSPELEDFRTLRTNLRFARPEGENRTVLVTSTAPQEGKTTIATNLAVVSAQAGERVLLVDADLRRPAVHLAVGLTNERGLTNLLVEGDAEGDTLRATAWPNLTVITAGAFAPNPPDILESNRMRELIASWRKRFDRVIIDSPPQSSVVDPSILAPWVDGVLLVISSGRVDAERARLARRQLQSAGAKFYGCVVNQLTRSADPYAYGYDYGYGPRPAATGDEPVTPLPREFAGASEAGDDASPRRREPRPPA